MKLAGEYTVSAPRQNVWNVLLDPALLARVLPGCEKLESLGDDTYRAGVKIQVGPLNGAFEGTIKLTNIVAPNSYHMEFDGKGALGFVRGVGDVQLADNGSTTLITYSGEASIGGKLASVGQRLMETSAKAMIKQTLDEITPIAQSLNTTSTNTTDMEHPTSNSSIVQSVTPNSQIAFGAGIMRHMFEDAVPEQYRPLVVLGVGVLFLFILSRMFRSGR
jgi:uncharacterized protein